MPTIEEPPRLSRVWQGAFFVTSCLSPAAMAAYGFLGQSRLFGLGISPFPLSAACAFLVYFSPPSNKAISRRLDIYVITFSLLEFCADSFGCLVTDDKGDGFWGWVRLVYTPVALGFKYFINIMRSKIGSFARERLETYVGTTLFLEGLGCLPSMVYLTTEFLTALART